MKIENKEVVIGLSIGCVSIAMIVMCFVLESGTPAGILPVVLFAIVKIAG